jgi:mono/diheme cytochrome c family protein
MRLSPWLLALAALAPPVGAADAPPAKPGGKALYVTHCSQCHGRDGKARPDYAKKGAVDLNDPDWQKARSDAEIHDVIVKGSKGTLMESFKDKLSAAEIDAVVAHVRTLKPRP